MYWSFDSIYNTSVWLFTSPGQYQVAYNGVFDIQQPRIEWERQSLN